jgi:hypothetical protein
MNRYRVTPLVALAAALVALSPAASRAGDSPVYRCAQADGRVLYTDVPCAGGAAVDIRPGKADPAATERLARAQASLDAAAAQRKADLAQEDAQRAQYGPARDGGAASVPAQADNTGYGYDFYGFGYAPGYGDIRPRPPRPRPPLPPVEKKVVPAHAKNLPTTNVPGIPDVVRMRR